MSGRRISAGILTALLVILVPGPYLLPLPGREGVDAAALAPADAHFVEVDGRRLYVEQDGPLDGPAVVLIHGLAGSTYTWRLTRPRLAAAGYRTLAIDLLGFGLSDKSFDADHGHAAQARRVVSVMEALGIGRAALIGHSMGASTAVQLALSRPELVDRLVLVNAWLQSESHPLWPGDLLDLPPVARWGRLAARTLATPDRLSAVLNTVYDDPDDIAGALAVGHFVPIGVRDWDLALLAIVRDAGRNQLPAPLSSIGAPTLIIWGAEDRWIDSAFGAELRDAIPGAEMVVIAGAGHLPFEERPAEFASVVLSFLFDQPLE